MRLRLFGVLAVTACQSTAERCHDITLQSFHNRVYEANEEEYERRVTRHPDYNAKFYHDSARTRMRHEVRYAMAVELRRSLPDSTRRFLPPPDSSAPKPEPPPKPSEPDGPKSIATKDPHGDRSSFRPETCSTALPSVWSQNSS